MNILFVCRGNALRSIMAETYVRSLGLSGIEVESCGTIASKNKVANADNFQVTVEVLQQHGLGQYISGQYGQDLSQELVDQATAVICMNQTVADEAAAKVVMPVGMLVWNIDDVDEGGRVTNTLNDRRRYSVEILGDIKVCVDELLSNTARP